MLGCTKHLQLVKSDAVKSRQQKSKYSFMDLCKQSLLVNIISLGGQITKENSSLCKSRKTKNPY